MATACATLAARAAVRTANGLARASSRQGALQVRSSFLVGSAAGRFRAAAAAPLASAHAIPRRSLSVRAIAVGDSLPAGELAYFDEEGNLQTVSIEALSKGKKLVLFAVPGAFTPTCSQKHLPGFIEKADELKSKGVDTIACISVNDAFVLKAWGESVGATGTVLLLADGSGKYTEALGVTLDLTDKGLGIRSRRYALLADDGVIKVLNLEDGGAFTVSSAEDILKAL